MGSLFSLSSADKEAEHRRALDLIRIENEEKEKDRVARIAAEKAAEKSKRNDQLLELAKSKMELEVGLKRHTIDKGVELGVKMQENGHSLDDAKTLLAEIVEITHKQELKAQIMNNNQLQYLQ